MKKKLFSLQDLKLTCATTGMFCSRNSGVRFNPMYSPSDGYRDEPLCCGQGAAVPCCGQVAGAPCWGYVIG